MKTSAQHSSKYSVLGVMSGTSLDGVDFAYCAFEKKERQWCYSIEEAETLKYTETWVKRLSSLENGSAVDFAQTDIDYGHFLGETCHDFLLRHNLHPDFIASHGHTIFHLPGNRLTWQIGKGACVAAETGIPVISDFRSVDVALGGQGAPLVPIGDKLLFGDFDYCLNLGGFGNISFESETLRIAFDICPVNIVLNTFSKLLGHEYDDDGKMAKTGNLHDALFKALDHLAFYEMSPPKSLGKEWVLAEFLPVVKSFDVPVPDILRTLCEHIATKVSLILPNDPAKKMLVTGGGAFNGYLIDLIRRKSGIQVIIPDALTINYKEALIFAFLGVLRWRNEPNCLRTVTGATKDNIGGSIYMS